MAQETNGDFHLSKEIQKLLAKVEDTPQEALISRLTLRSLKQARYSVQCTGHFGLAASYYTHFTSPIRRYPDLQIHRIIKESLKSGLGERRIAHYEDILPDVAAVSYTHLDVYKRQSQNRAPGLGRCCQMKRFL